MRRNGGGGACLAVWLHPRQVEGFEQADWAGSARLQIDAAPELFTVERDDLASGTSCGVGGVDADDDLSVDVNHHWDGCAEHFGVQVSCGLEDGVAEGFGVNSPEVLA